MYFLKALKARGSLLWSAQGANTAHKQASRVLIGFVLPSLSHHVMEEDLWH